MKILRLAACALLLLVAPGISQEPERDRGFGLVRDTSGRPWVGATVHLVHQVHPAVPGEGYTDRIRAVTDGEGRFRCELLVGARYVAWAMGDLEDHSFRCTEVADDVVARTPILLDEREPAYQRRLRLVVHPTFEDKAPVLWVATARIGSWRASRVLRVAGDGVVELPPWPAPLITVNAWTEGWRVFAVSAATTVADAQRRGVIRGRPNGADRELSDQLRSVTDVAMPPRQQRGLTIVAAGSSTPIAGVRVVHDSTTPSFGPPPVSDKQGRVGVVFADEDPDARFYFRSALLADGYAEGSVHSSSYEPGTVEVTRPLDPGKTVRGRILLGDEPLARLPVLLDASIGTGPGGTWFGVSSRVFSTDPEGRLVVEGRTDRYPYRLTAVLTAALRERLRGGDSDASPIAPLAMIAAERVRGPEDLGDVRLEGLRALDVTVTHPDGTPPGSVRVLVLPILERGSHRPHEPLAAHTDRRGRVRVLVGGATELFVYSATEAGAAWRVSGEQDRAVTLALDPLHLVTLRVLDAKGEPLAGHLVGYVTPRNPSADADSRVLDLVRDLSMNQVFRFKYGRTDESGLVKLVSPMLDVDLDLSVSAPDGGSGRVIVKVPADHGGEPLDVTPVLEKR